MEKKILNVGVISCSNMAQGHMRGVVNNPNAKLVAVCDIDTEKLNTVAERFNVPKKFTDYKELLAQPDIDAVIIVTPDQLHREMAVAALEAGKHVLCEKPLAITREDCKAIADATKKTDKKFMVGQICRYTPGFKAAKAIIDRGDIGELMFVESEYAHDYEDILKPGVWRYDPLRNGVVGGGCHAVDLLRWVVGEDPEEVKAYSTKKIFKDLPYDDTHIAIMKFPNGVIGKMFCSISCKRNYTMRSVFYGTKGTIITDNKNSEITVFRTAPGTTEDTDNLLFPDKKQNQTIPVKYPVSIASHNAQAEFEEFCKIVLEDLPVKTTVYEGAKTIATCFAIVEAADTGKTVIPDYNF